MKLVKCLLFGLCFLLISGAADQKTITFSDGTTCGMEGTAKSKSGKALNRLKNRFNIPKKSDIDPDVSLAAMLAPGDDHSRWDDDKAAKIVGFCIDVIKGGKGESCNCKATAPIDCDTHIELALHKTAPDIQRVIVEVTPRLRQQMKAKGTDWTSEKLRDIDGGIRGEWVEITGWLMFDTIHADEAENTHPGGEHNWRATAWEIHPVTGIKILDGPPADAHDLHPNHLRAFQRSMVRTLDREPARRDAMRAKIKAMKDEFDPEELMEDRPASRRRDR